MITRVAAGLVLAGIAAVAVSSQVFARAAGGFMGRGPVSSSPRMHAHPATPVAHPATPAVHSGGALVGGRSVAGAHAFRHNVFRHPHRFRNRAWSGRQWYDGYYGPYDYGSYYGDSSYGPTDYVPPYYEPASTYWGPGYPVGGGAPDISQKVIYVLPYRPSCDSETQRVPGKSGSEHAVTIVRC